MHGRDPIGDDAFSVGELFERRAVRASATNLHDDAFKIARGEVEPVAPIRFVKAEGSRLRDVIGTTWGVLRLVSPRFLATLERGGFTGWTTYDVELADGLERAAGYRGFAVTGRCGKVEDALSEEVVLPPKARGGEATNWWLGSFFPAGSWDGSDVFTPPDHGSIWVVSAVKESLERSGITGIAFTPLAEMERPIFDDSDFEGLDDEAV